jgi:hypothetical protein
MKMKLICSIALTMLLVNSCRKQEDVILPNNSKIIAETCSNGVKDANEYGVDCGGPDCGDCTLSVANCSLFLYDNEVEYTSFPTSTYSSTVISSTIVSGKLVINSGGTAPIKFTFPSSNPTFFTSYTVTNNPNPTGNEVYVEHIRSFYNFVGLSGIVHLNKVNGTNMVEFCDVDLNDSSFGISTTSRGRLID